MIRKIIKIDEEKCTGCGLCAEACHEAAIKIENGKAKLISDDYCDGLGDCLPECPVKAISFEDREAKDYDRTKVEKNLKERKKENLASLKKGGKEEESCLKNWPVQIRLCPGKAEYFEGADILIASDCTGFSYARLHEDFINGRVCLIGCPKLDDFDYIEKLAEIFKKNDIKSILILRMEVPCCSHMTSFVKEALLNSGKSIKLTEVVLSVEGKIL